MNYLDVERIFGDKGLNGEPAFDDVGISVSPIQPDEKGFSPLGLYFPHEKVIVVPPGLPASSGSIGESVLLHELGHRFGHFHYNDITEPFAEKYRSKYQDVHGKVAKMSSNVVEQVKPCKVCKAPESLCPYCEYGGHNIKVEFAGSFAVPSFAQVSGGIGRVEIIWPQLNGQPVTKVPQGDLFSIRAVDTWANNPSGVLVPGTWKWDIKLTCIEIPASGDALTVPNLGTLAQEMANFGNNEFVNWDNIPSTGGTRNFDLTDIQPYLVMPNRDIRLRIKLWAYPARSTGIAIPRSQW